MSLEKLISPNFITDMEFMHRDLNKDRHNDEDMGQTYTTFLTDICERNGMYDKDKKGIKIKPVKYHLENAHCYYVGRYKCDWFKKEIFTSDSIPSFLLKEQAY